MICQPRALNEISDEEESTEGGQTSSDGQALSIEALENNALEAYGKAVLNIAQGRCEEAEATLRHLLELKLFQEHAGISRAGLSKSITKLRCAIERNLAGLVSKRGLHAEAMELYIKVCEHEVDDFLAFYNVGVEAWMAFEFDTARNAFVRANALNPNYFPCLVKLASTLFVVDDYGNCIIMLAEICRRSPMDLRSHILKDEIFREVPYFKTIAQNMFEPPNITYGEEEKDRVLIPLKVIKQRRIPKPTSTILESVVPTESRDINSLSEFGDMICHTYNWLTDQPMGLARPFDWQHFWKFPSANRATASPSNAVPIGDEKDSLFPENKENSTDEAEKEKLNGDISMDYSFPVAENDTEVKECPMDKSAENDRGPVEDTKDAGEVLESAKDANHQANLSTSMDQLSAVFKRRSTRLIPGFRMEDPDAFGPYTARKLSLRDKLIMLFPSEMLPDSDNSDSLMSLQSSTTSCTESSCRPLTADQENETLKRLVDSWRPDSMLGLMEEFLAALTVLENDQWPVPLAEIYLQVQKLWSQHVDDVGTCLYNAPFSVAEKYARIHLLAAEIGYCKASDDYDLPIANLLAMLKAADRFKYSMFAVRASYLFGKRHERMGDYQRASNWYIRCQQALELGCTESVLHLPNSGDVISVNQVKERIRETAFQVLIEFVDIVTTLGDLDEAVSMLERTMAGCGQVPHPKICSRLLLLCQCYQRADKRQACVPNLCKLFRGLVHEYRCVDVGEKRSMWNIIDSALGVASWLLLESENGVSYLDKASRQSLADSMLELISFADEYPFYKRDIPDDCWLTPYKLLYVMVNDLVMRDVEATGTFVPYESPSSETKVITKSLAILTVAHEVLGSRSLCTLKNGALLTFLVDEVLKTLRHPAVVSNRSTVGINECLVIAEQCFYCLYRYPQKKKRYLAEHGSPAAELTWERGITVYDFLCPVKLPECDEHTNSAISSELVFMFRQILRHAPASLRPDTLLPGWDAYFDQNAPDPPMLESSNPDVHVEANMYYLMADHYMKNLNFEMAVDCYQRHLTLSDELFSGWAGLGMTCGALLERRLVSREMNYDDQDDKHVSYWAHRLMVCFNRASKMDSTNITILVEHATSAYYLHSFLSRLIRKKTSMSNEVRVSKILMKQKYLQTVSRVLHEILSLGLNHVDSKEHWLIYYFLGKVAEKQKDSLNNILVAYFKATYSLYIDGETCPNKIQFKEPFPRGILERLEVFYRMHVCVLKSVIRNELDHSSMLMAYHFLLYLHSSAFSLTNEVILDAAWQQRWQQRETDSFVYTIENVSQVLNRKLFQPISQPLLQLAAPAEGELKAAVLSLCRDGFVACIQRFSYHYKAYFRLAQYYFCLAPNPQPALAVELLFGPIESPCLPFPNALLQIRKQGHLFENIWVYPVDDISRCGSFPEHVFRTAQLLIALFESLENHTALCDLLMYHRKRPESESRKYMVEVDRLFCYSQLQCVLERLLERKFNESMDYYNRMCYYVTACRVYTTMNRIAEFKLSAWKELILRMFRRMTLNPTVTDLGHALSYSRRFTESVHSEANRPWKPFPQPSTKKRTVRPGCPSSARSPCKKSTEMPSTSIVASVHVASSTTETKSASLDAANISL